MVGLELTAQAKCLWKSPRPSASLFFKYRERKKKEGETCHGILISSCASHLLPDFASSCSSNNSSPLGTWCWQPQATHQMLGVFLQCPQLFPYTTETSHSHNPGVASGHVTFSRTSQVSRLVPRPNPAGWKGCFSFSKRPSPHSRYHTEIGRGRQGCAPSASFPLAQLPAPSRSPSTYRPGTCHLEIV